MGFQEYSCLEHPLETFRRGIEELIRSSDATLATCKQTIPAWQKHQELSRDIERLAQMQQANFSARLKRFQERAAKIYTVSLAPFSKL